MKKIILASLVASIPALVQAQSTVDAYAISQNDLRGTARFMSMGGAFTALGGDLSTLGQNPAGIGVYRSSEFGATLDINMRGYKTSTSQGTSKDNQTKVFCNNFGYIGTARLDGILKTFNWGASYGRRASFDRIINGYNIPTQTSLTNYIAGFSEGYSPKTLGFDEGYNPYIDSDADWLSILAYNSYMINPLPGGENKYAGLFQNGTTGDAMYTIREHGYTDEYNFDLGGNFNDLVYWGIGFGITDISYWKDSYYSESLENAYVPSAVGMATGNAGFDLYNSKHISGSGWNFKAGVIIRPIPELRIGAAIHTPTWYKLTHHYQASVDYSYFNPAIAEGSNNPVTNGNEPEYTDEAGFESRINSPWRFMIGAAAVIGNQAIVSVDYERVAFNDMRVKYSEGGYYSDFVNDDAVENNIKDCFKGSNIVRLGLEYRVTPQFSLRAGYNVEASNVKSNATNGTTEILTSGTDPSYSLDKTTQYISFGLGYRYQSFYIDAAYVHKNRKSTFHAYTDFNGFAAPTADVTDNNNSIVISAGFKF